jgi:hypothetical protein
MASKKIPDCHPLSLYFARGLCRPCYNHHAKAGTLGHFPRTTLPADDFASRYISMRTAGLSRTAMAEALGIDRHAVAQAYYRAVRLGEVTPDGPRVTCGTEAGYQAHRRRGEPACQPCKDDRARAARDRHHARARVAAETEVS